MPGRFAFSGERMKTKIMGAALLAGLSLVSPASAASGQCSLTGYDPFECDVELDGSGLTFGLPDGQIFAFAVTGDGEGLGYRIPAGAAPGQRPIELGRFVPVAAEPGCWQGERSGIKFCASVMQ